MPLARLDPRGWTKRGREEEEGEGEKGSYMQEQRVDFILDNTYPISVATRFCVLLTISKILTVRSEEQVASLFP